MNIDRIASRVIARHSIVVSSDDVGRVLMMGSGTAVLMWESNVAGPDEVLKAAQSDARRIRQRLRERIHDPLITDVESNEATGFSRIKIEHPLLTDPAAFAVMVVGELGFNKG